MRENLLPSLFPTSCSNGNESIAIQFTSDCFNHLVKIPQIRQKRVVRDLCTVPTLLKNITDTCQALLSSATEDRATYEYSWLKLDTNNLNRDDESVWKYQEEIKKREPHGKRDTSVPTLDGYIAKLDHTLQKSLGKLTYLKNSNWIDSLTRELFVEFILYNTNTNMFCLVRLQLSHPANGFYTTQIEVDSIILGSVKTNYLILFSLVCNFFLILILAWRALFNAQLYGICGYATRMGKMWEYSAVITGIFVIFWFSLKYLDFFMYSEHMKQSLQSDYIFFSIISTNKYLKFFAIYLMGFVIMVFLFSFRFGKPFEVMILTIWYSTPRVFAIAKISLVFVGIVETIFVLSQNPPLFCLVYPFRLFREKNLFTNKSLDFYLCFISFIVHVLSLVFVLINFIESRFQCIGRKSYNLLHFVYKSSFQKCRKQD